MNSQKSKSEDLVSRFVPLAREIFGSSEFIPLHAPEFSGCEKSFVLDAIDSTFVSSVGAYVDRFERELEQITGAKHAVATSSGTAALHVSLILVGVESGDEVITQTLTFVATCNAIRYCGADPVFVDVEPSTLGLCPDKLHEFLGEHAEIRDDGCCWNKSTGKRIRACVPVNNLGHPSRVDELASICKSYNLSVVEDAAESLGSIRGEQHAGLAGDVGILSFNGNKIITTGGGGAILTENQELAARAKHQTTTAKLSHPWLFLHDTVGFNYRLPNLNAALGCAQLKQLEQFVEAKRALAKIYENWSATEDLDFVQEPKGAKSNYWLNAVLVKDRETRDEFLEFTNARGVMTRPMWTPMHSLPMYQNCTRTELPVSEDIESKLVCIPSSVPPL